MVDLASLLITFLCLPRHCLNLNRWGLPDKKPDEESADIKVDESNDDCDVRDIRWFLYGFVGYANSWSQGNYIWDGCVRKF
jgi:hypothetical protein